MYNRRLALALAPRFALLCSIAAGCSGPLLLRRLFFALVFLASAFLGVAIGRVIVIRLAMAVRRVLVDVDKGALALLTIALSNRIRNGRVRHVIDNGVFVCDDPWRPGRRSFFGSNKGGNAISRLASGQLATFRQRQKRPARGHGGPAPHHSHEQMNK
jgi:hypothetical protein